MKMDKMTNAEYAAGLRMVADFYEAHPDMDQPYPQMGIYLYQREEFIKQAMILSRGGMIEKKADSLDSTLSYYRAIREFGGISVQICIDRKAICRLVSPAVYECPESLLEEQAAEYVEAE